MGQFQTFTVTEQKHGVFTNHITAAQGMNADLVVRPRTNFALTTEDRYGIDIGFERQRRFFNQTQGRA